MQRIALALALSALAGCAQHSKAPDVPPPPTAQTKAASLAEQLLGDTMGLSPLPDTVFREGDRLSYAVLQPKTDASPFSFMAQIEASCSVPGAQLVFINGDKRIYFGGPDGQYMPGREVPPRLVETLKKNAEFNKACSSTPKPDWRIVKGSGAQPWVMIDRNSVKSQGNALRFWAAYDDPVITLDPPYNAPTAQKREHFAVDCSKQTYSLLAGYDVDERNTVTDGAVFFAPKAEPIAAGNADYQVLFKTVCGKPDALAKLPAFSPRTKAPVATPLPGVAALPLTAIKRLNLPKPAKSLKRLVETGTSSTKDSNVALNEERYLETDKATGQLGIRLRGENYDGSEVSFRGLVALAQKTAFRGKASMTDTANLTNLTFTGNWRELPVGEKVGYATQANRVNSVVGAYGQNRQVVSCTVDSQAPAALVNAALSGNAKKLRCSTDGDKYQRVDTVYYLEDYGYFYRAGTDKNDFFYDERHLKTVE
ncbi:MAG: hypothetical protein PW845_28295 [Pseudomonas sp.]|uniref:hypothetical protein n=1 Tax=Pseudomonas abieticivorans TaxID=2931382 RepID=UPI0020C117C9|nr:hypothetical protein [Pseudomonas sp. PIA16]MDE1169181.1 hypothetical protein [Pseudomonas sp.]